MSQNKYSNRKPVIAVIGASSCGKELSDLAYETGRVIAEAGCILLNGGGKGVMEASARGAKEAGGLTVGIIPAEDKKWSNPFIDIVIATGMGQARNTVIAGSADGVIAVGGAYGTLSEVAFTLKHGKPIAGISSWERVLPEVTSFDHPQEAVDFILKKIGQNG
ncbi:MAG: TIGR00725 family protein [Candidatus Aureabacteria bacterium]|nr:TIGR00725 family protein [Candidatus Auribacterota bacterium]